MKKVLCIALCLMFVVSNFTTAFALENDYENNWAKNEIEYMKNTGIISGYPDGSFKPSNNMTKAEFYKVINRIMGYTTKSEINFKDVVPNNWYYDEVAKGIAADYIIPAVTLEAGKNITRGEVARIIGIAFSIEGDKQEANKFVDSDKIPVDIKDTIGGLKKSGFINGYPDGSFRVDAEITRAEVVKMLHNIVGEIINKEGVFSKNADKNVVVNASGVTLKDMEIGENLYLTEGIAEGNAELDNVKVKNTTIINGGGANSINIKNSQLKNMLLNKKQNLLNLILSNSKIDLVKSTNELKLDLVKGSSIKELELKGKVELNLEKGTLIEKLTITEGNITINSQASINYIKSNVEFTVNETKAKANVEYTMLDGKLSIVNTTGTGGSGGSGGTGGTGGNVPPVVLEYTVTFKLDGGNLNGSTADKLVKVNDKATVQKPGIPTKSSYIFVAWTEVNSTKSFDFSTAITKDLTLIAKWEKGTAIVDKSELQAAITLANLKIESEYTVESWSVFALALQAAKTINSNATATQAEVNSAMNSLKNTMLALVKKSSGTTPSVIARYIPTKVQYFPFISVELKNLQDAANFSIEYFILQENGEGKLTETSIFGINEETGMIYYNPNKFETITVKIYDQNKTLIHTFEDVVPILFGDTNPTVDKTALKAAIATADLKVESEYTTESWSVFALALQSAKTVNNNTNATQNEVNTVLTNLNNAIAGLKLKTSGPAATISAKYYSTLIENMVTISVVVENLKNAAKFDVVFNFSDSDDGTPNLEISDKANINEQSEGVWYDPSSKYKTITIRIYDADDTMIHTFENVTAVKGN